MDDLISRQAAIDALKTDMASLDHIIKDMSDYDVRLDAYVSQRNQVNYDIYTINNLPPAQPEPCEDAVSRQAVQYLLAHFVDEDKYVDACDGLKHLPSVTPEQRTGKWIYHIDDLFPAESTQECDQCHSEQPLECDDNYCPNCGVKMISEGKTCDCYRDGTCIGTKEIDSCSCGGVKSKCDFYEHVRWEGDAE